MRDARELVAEFQASGMQIERADIFNLLGEQVMQIEGDTDTRLNVQHNLEQGVYLVQIKTNQGIAVKKMTILE